MNKKKEIVPKLRFSEFSKSYWGITQLNMLAGKITERNKDDSIKRVFTNSATEGVIDQEEYFDRNIANKNNLTDYFVVEKGDYVYNPRISTTALVGPISKNKLGIGVMSPLYTIFRFKNKGNDFYEHFFLTNLWHAYIKNLSNTGARHDRITISVDNFMKMPLPYASPEEQQKIADCLSSIDELIDTESRKLKALEKYKKGLMQKLFPTEGKTLPEWRFPEFQGCGEWKYEEIGNIGEVITGKTPSTSDAALWDGDIQFVTPTDITENKYQHHTQRTVVKTPKMKVLPKYTIMYTCIASIGKMALSLYPCITNQQINSIVPKSFYNNEFIYYSLLQKTFLIKAGFANSTLPIINKTDFSKIQVPVILDKKEQEKIAGCLSEIDTMITEQLKKIERLETHKKGLMQGLFPSLEEADV
ncbi:restriction endonuclease subunit S [Helicobacter canadensis]|uniref:Methylase-S type I restriction modification domain containing protein n=1 Tax=Helicobacter canadensis MIT 98-5491 TaxID=537970 RepID=C5ZYY7_9HELI|nr:restriction endonuclease subunit S [Helicobacter canadensis]EES89245.1 methylase-S type I restriction modification domain containing protein [Helicobacter canadensis MIT 98-5491]